MKLLIRRLLLAGSGAVFALISLAAIVRPAAVAERYGLRLDGMDAMNEFRAVFVGFWAALAVMLLTAARRPEVVVLGDLCGLALLLQAAGRMLSVVVDGAPRPEFLAAMVGEALTGAVILILRPMNRAPAS